MTRRLDCRQYKTARVARNTQLILQEETGICDVADPWGGSYMMESLTDELAEKATKIIKEVEDMGGMTSYINKGMAKLRIEESATKKQGRIDSRKDVIVGVNKYRLSEEEEKAEMIDVLQIDNSDVRAKQIARIEKSRQIVMKLLLRRRLPNSRRVRDSEYEH